ncbi:MAG TPA: S8 family peptidase [Candidatus Limnocylindrales bacterium]
MTRPFATHAIRPALVALLLLGLAVPATIAAVPPSTSGAGDAPQITTPRSIIVRYRAGTPRSLRLAARGAAAATFERELRIINADVVTPRPGTMAATLAALRRDPSVLAAAPSQPLAIHADPVTEPRFDEQWGHQNTGQNIFGVPGVSDVDTDAREAIAGGADGSGVVVAVIDDGVDFDHPELATQAWNNPGESGGGKASNGVDDDHNGFIDDVHGWDVCNDSNTLHETVEDYHGTAVAGVIAASQNGSGMVGVAPGARIMGLRFLTGTDPNLSNCADDVHAILAIEYAADMGADIINASWGGPEPGDGALQAAIEASGIPFIASAGNGGGDQVGDNIDDGNPFTESAYPAGYDSPNMIVVAANDNRGRLAEFSNFGRTSVDLAAPGVSVLAPVADSSVSDYWDGTSFSAPYVSGVAALVLSEQPGMSPEALRARLMSSGSPLSSTSGKTVSGRQVNAVNALDFSTPVADVVTVKPLEGRSLGTSSVVVRVGWGPGTDDIGVASYGVRFREGSGAWTTLVGSTTRRYVDRTLAFGRHYEFEIRFRDAAGNFAARVLPVTMARYQENAAQVHYTGTWTSAAISTASGGRTRATSRASATATFSFVGKGVGLVAPLGPSRGAARIYLDGVFVRSIDLHSATTIARRVVFARNWTVNGNHSLKVVVRGTGPHPRFDVDAIAFSR